MKNSDQFYKRRQKIKICLQVTCVFSVTDSQHRRKFHVRAWTRKKIIPRFIKKNFRKFTFKNSSKVGYVFTMVVISILHAEFEMTIGKTCFRGEPWESMKSRKIFQSSGIFCLSISTPLLLRLQRCW